MRARRWLETLLIVVRNVATSLLIVIAIHVLATYFGWSLGAVAE